MRRTATGWLGVTVVAYLWGGPAAAITPWAKCEANKVRTAGKYAYCRMNAESKAIKKGEAPDYSRCDASFAVKWDALEAGGTCPVAGDQAAIQTQATGCTGDLAAAIGSNRFVDNVDGTITDNRSGLMWEKKTELDGVAVGANRHDADNRYNWSGYCSISFEDCQPNSAAATACFAGAEGSANGCAECTGGDGTCTVSAPAVTTVWDWVTHLNAASYGGYTDWRVPTLQELQTIVDYTDTTPPAVNLAFQGASCGAACTDIASAACSCTALDFHWSATSYSGVPEWAWYITFSDGQVDYYGKADHFYSVRAVRGGS